MSEPEFHKRTPRAGDRDSLNACRGFGLFFEMMLGGVSRDDVLDSAKFADAKADAKRRFKASEQTPDESG